MIEIYKPQIVARDTKEFTAISDILNKLPQYIIDQIEIVKTMPLMNCIELTFKKNI